MNRETIEQTTRLWQTDPQKAKTRPAVTARSDGAQAVLEAGAFSWRCDLPQPLGGSNTAPSPTALLLGALAGCGVVFMRDTLAPQLGMQIDAIEAVAQCSADARGLLGLDGVAPDLDDFEVRISVQSAEPQERIDELFRVWQERCPIYLALSKPLRVRAQLHTQAAASV